MKITFVMFANVLNGGNRVIGLVAAGLAARGHDVQIVAQPLRTRSLRQKLRHLLRERAWPANPQEGPFLDAIRDRVHVLDRRRPAVDADLPDADVVVATWWETAPWVNALSPAKGAKAYFMQDYGAPSQEIEKLVPTWRMPFAFITLNSRLEALIRAENPDTPITIMRNAVDHALFATPPRGRGTPPTIGLMQRAQPTKGMNIAARALEQVRAAIPDLRVRAVGTSLADLPDWVELVHRPDDQALAQVYRSCDLWLFPSSMEGFGLPIIEAMASRTPVISTRVGGAEDVITDGESGYLVEINDWHSMAARAVDVLSGPEADWRALSEAAYRAVADHSWDDAIDVFEAALVEAASDAQPVATK